MVKISKPLVQDGLVCQDGLDETDVFAWRVCECGGLMEMKQKIKKNQSIEVDH